MTHKNLADFINAVSSSEAMNDLEIVQSKSRQEQNIEIEIDTEIIVHKEDTSNHIKQSGVIIRDLQNNDVIAQGLDSSYSDIQQSDIIVHERQKDDIILSQ